MIRDEKDTAQWTELGLTVYIRSDDNSSRLGQDGDELGLRDLGRDAVLMGKQGRHSGLERSTGLDGPFVYALDVSPSVRWVLVHGGGDATGEVLVAVRTVRKM